MTGQRGHPAHPCPADLAVYKAKGHLTEERRQFPFAPELGDSQRVLSLKLGGQQWLHRGLGGGWRRLGG